jgi:polysaccharide biosynthesis protein PslG
MAKDGLLAAACSRMRGRQLHGRILGLLITALAVAAPSASAASFYGVNAGYAFDLPADQRDHHLDLMAEAGVDVVRRDASWSGAEPDAPDPVTGEHHYRWQSTDATAATLASHGLTWYPILDYSTGWASEIPGNPMSAPRPDAIDDYAAYAAAFAARYGPEGAFWTEHPELPWRPVAAYELGNEPNAAMFWREQATAPEVYADEYAAARAAIKAVDSTTPVVSAGLLDANTMDPSVFLRRMIRRQPSLRTRIDAFGYHPYQMSYAGMRDGIRSVRATLRSLRMGSVPIEITEAGMTTAWISEAVRAKAIGTLARTLPDDKKLNVTRFLPYEWAAREQSADFGDWWGIMHPDGSPTATGVAYLSAVRTSATRSAKTRARARAKTRRRA